MPFWTWFWMIAPPVALIIIELIYYFGWKDKEV
jgi:hypothetical protein